MATDDISLSWTPGDPRIVWARGSIQVEKVYAAPPRSVTVWPGPPAAVIVVEAIVEGGRLDNAVVFDIDGSERVRLVPPVLPEPTWARGFYEVFVSKGRLVAVFVTQVGDLWGTPNLDTGELSDVSPWR